MGPRIFAHRIRELAHGPHIRITEKVAKLEVARVIDELMTRKPKNDVK